MRKLLFGLFGFAALGFGALVAQPAEAQPYYRGYGPGWGAPVVSVQYGPGREYRRDRGYRDEYRRDRRREYRRPYREVRRGYGPPPAYGFYRPAYVAPRCVLRPQSVWNGYRWIRQSVRVCR
jgi:hypothetical protein